MQRLLIIGISGSGKTTLARELSHKLGLPLFSLDKLFWLPDWQMPDLDDWQHKLESIAVQDRWIVEGNYLGTHSILMPRADAVIYFDLPRRVAFYRVIKRYLAFRGQRRSDLPDGCEDKLDWDFLKYMWLFPRIRKPIIEAALETFVEEKKVYRIRSMKDLNDLHIFLAERPL
jgi:adenylate kinase family enzyme